VKTLAAICVLSAIGAAAFVHLDSLRHRQEVRLHLIQQFERECAARMGMWAGVNYDFCVQDKVKQLKPFTLL
jgi:hypothetical protein